MNVFFYPKDMKIHQRSCHIPSQPAQCFPCQSLTHSQPFLHPGQEIFDVLGRGLGIEQSRLHSAVILEQGQVYLFLPWQRHLWACTSSRADTVKPETRQQRPHSLQVELVVSSIIPTDVWEVNETQTCTYIHTHTYRVKVDVVGGYESVRHLLK